MPLKVKEREYRDFTLAPDEVEDKMLVRGYASTFNQPYTLYSDDTLEIREQISSDAFREADMSDVIFQYNHEGRVFARMSNGTLGVSTDDIGLAIVADLGGTEIGRNLFEEIRGGYTTKMSFGFRVNGETWDSHEENGKILETRTITGVEKVYDVSAVSIPANDGTSISVRSLTDGVIEKIKAERLAAFELEKRKTLLLLGY
jgi:HK97 family phage prohead protease